MEGRTQASRSINEPGYIPGNGNAGPYGGGTYTGTSLEPMQADWENIFGPAGRDVKLDHQRQKRHHDNTASHTCEGTDKTGGCRANPNDESEFQCIH